MRIGHERSAQSASLGLPIEGASLPTSLQKFQASNAILVLGFFVAPSPIHLEREEELSDRRSRGRNKSEIAAIDEVYEDAREV